MPSRETITAYIVVGLMILLLYAIIPNNNQRGVDCQQINAAYICDPVDEDNTIDESYP